VRSIVHRLASERKRDLEIARPVVDVGQEVK
jgi:hypothetical protein